MANVKRTEHTVLVQITSAGSGGRAKILCGHAALADPGNPSPTFLTSNHFNQDDFLIGDIVVARIRLSGERRLTQFANKDDDIKSIGSFVKIYSLSLKNEAEAFRKKYRLTGLSPITPDILDVVYIANNGDQVGGYETTVDDVISAVGLPPPANNEWQRLYDTIKAGTQGVPVKEEVVEDLSEWLNNAYIPKQDRVALETLRNIAKKRHVAAMLVGGSGYGKTTMGEQMAKEWGMTFYRQDCAGVRDPEEFFGFRAAADGSTVDSNGDPLFIMTEFTRILTEGNCVIVLDELNRIDPYISNILFPLLDHAGKTRVAGHEIAVGENVIFLATLNLGFQFTGTFTLDTALRNRFMLAILVGALPPDIEKKIIRARGEIDAKVADIIVDFMSALRTSSVEGRLSIDASTRVSINLAQLVGAGMSIKDAVTYSVINGVNADEAKLIVDQLNVSLRK